MLKWPPHSEESFLLPWETVGYKMKTCLLSAVWLCKGSMSPLLSIQSVYIPSLLSWNFDFMDYLWWEKLGVWEDKGTSRDLTTTSSHTALVRWNPCSLGWWLLADETCQLTSPGTRQAYGVRVNIYLHLMRTVLHLFVYLLNRQLGFTEQILFVLYLGYWASKLWKTAFRQACPSLVCGACLQLLLWCKEEGIHPHK